MSQDIQLPEMPDIAPTDDWDSVLECVQAYARAAVLSDRQDRWISVSDRKPGDTNDLVIAWRRGRDDCELVCGYVLDETDDYSHWQSVKPPTDAQRAKETTDG